MNIEIDAGIGYRELLFIMLISFSLATVLWSFNVDRNKKKVALVESGNACVVLNGDPSIVQIISIWPCDKAMAVSSENFIVLRKATKQDLN